MKVIKKSLSLAFAAVFIFTVTILDAAWGSIPTATIEKARDATVLIATDGDNAGGFGTGVIIDSSGIVVTNYHVIHRATTIRVFFYNPNDLNYYEADVIGVDPVADLALIQIKVRDDMLPLTYLRIEPENFLIGEEVVAIGHMLGLQWSVTQGTLNNLERPGKITPYVTILQHSAQINKGNSGGPLINKNGDIVGINTYILLPKGGWSGIAYAIRGDNVHRTVKQITETGTVQYTALKIGLRNVNEFFIKAVKREWPDQKIPTGIFGMMSLYIEEDDWAYEHGIRNFDILVAFDGTPVNYLYALKEIIKEYKPGDKVKLIVIRNSHFITIDYELSEIDFKEYLKFYDKSIKERFNEGGRLTAPPEKEEKKEGLIPPPKRLLVPDSEDPGLPDNEKRNGDKNGTNG